MSWAGLFSNKIFLFWWCGLDRICSVSAHFHAILYMPQKTCPPSCLQTASHISVPAMYCPEYDLKNISLIILNFE